MHQRAKLYVDRLTFAEIWPLFECLKWRPSAILNFQSSKFYLPVRQGRLICVSVSHFMPIGRRYEKIWPILDFSRWRPSAIWDLFYVYLDHPRIAFVGLCHCTKFHCNRCSSFDNMPVLMFCEFGLKMPIHASFGWFLGDLTTQMSPSINQSYKS